MSARTADPLDEKRKGSGGPIGALEERGTGRVLRGQGEENGAVERRAEIDKENHRG